MRTFWYCEQCQEVAWSNHEEHDDVMTVTNKIEFDHKRLKPECPNNVIGIRIVNLPVILGNELPDYAVTKLVYFFRERL